MIRSGDIVLYRAPWWLRWLMRYYHAALVYWNGEAWRVIEATWPRVRKGYLSPSAARYHVYRPKGNGQQAVALAFSRLGERYSIRQALQVLWRCLMKKLGRPLPLAVACSPLVSWAWGLNAFTPDEIAEEVERV